MPINAGDEFVPKYTSYDVGEPVAAVHDNVGVNEMFVAPVAGTYAVAQFGGVVITSGVNVYVRPLAGACVLLNAIDAAFDVPAVVTAQPVVEVLLLKSVAEAPLKPT